MDLYKYPLSGPFINNLRPSGRKLYINRPYITACRRAVAYKASETPRTDPVPWHDEALAHTSRVMTPVVLQALKAHGWNIIPIAAASTNSDHYSQWRPHDNLGLTAIPDAFGSHPEHTNGLKTVITAAWQPESHSPPPGESHLLNMLTAFLKAYSKEPTVKHDAPAVLAVLTLHQPDLHIATLRPREVHRKTESLRQHLKTLSDFTNSPTAAVPNLPDRDYEPGSTTCAACPWRSTCHSTN